MRERKKERERERDKRESKRERGIGRKEQYNSNLNVDSKIVKCLS